MNIPPFIEFCVLCCLSLSLLLGGCGETPIQKETTESMIADLVKFSEKDEPWEVLSLRGGRIVDAIKLESNQVERIRLLRKLQRAMRSFKAPRVGQERRLRRIWALHSICHRMRACWWGLEMPEMVVEDWLFVLEKYGEELERIGPEDKDSTSQVYTTKAGAPQYTEYDKVRIGREAVAQTFENHVFPRALPKLSPSEQKKIEIRFAHIMRRPLHLSE